MLKERLSPSLGSKLLSQPIAKVAYNIINPKPLRSAPAQKGLNFEGALISNQQKKPLNIFKGTKTRGAKFEQWVKENEFKPEDCMTESEFSEIKPFLSSMGAQGVIPLIEGMRYQEHLESTIDHCFCDFSNDDLIIEMKVTSQAQDFGKHIAQMNYDLQCYMQMKLTNHQREFRWLVIDADAPHVATLLEPHADVMASGERKYKRCRELFDRLNEYEGLGPISTHTVDIPSWAKH